MTDAGHSPKYRRMSDVKALVKRAEAFSKESGLALSTVSTKMFNDGKRLDELKTGKSRIWPETVEKALTALIEAETEYRNARAS